MLLALPPSYRRAVGRSNNYNNSLSMW
jgi:hypothetical protein